MSNLLFLDVETTGLETEDRLCQVGFEFEEGDGVAGLFKPPVPIKVGAMAVNHITNTMVEKAPVFADSDIANLLKKLSLEKSPTSFNDAWVLVAHNAPFDLGMLKKEGIEFSQYIDTKKLSHKLDKDDSMESHRLQYLRYFYEIEIPEAVAHTAEGDVKVLAAVYRKLREKLGYPTIKEMIEISKKPVLYSKFKFGKYNGNTIADIAATDPGYLNWLLKQKKENNQNEEDWIYTLEHYLKS